MNIFWSNRQSKVPQTSSLILRVWKECLKNRNFPSFVNKFEISFDFAEFAKFCNRFFLPISSRNRESYIEFFTFSNIFLLPSFSGAFSTSKKILKKYSSSVLENSITMFGNVWWIYQGFFIGSSWQALYFYPSIDWRFDQSSWKWNFCVEIYP